MKRLRAGRERAWRICAGPALAPVLLGSALLCGCGAASVALAAEGQVSGASAAIFFAQVGVLLLVGRALGELMQRFGQPEVMGQLLGGLLLGPSLLGLVSPHLQHTLFPPTAEQKGMLDAVSQLGMLLLLLLTGMETDLRLVRRVGRSAMAVAAAGVALPFMCGFALGALLPDSLLPHAQSRFVTALFLATALSISSIKIVAVVVREMNFMRRDIGQIIVASAILEDTAGWVIIAISFGLASSGTMDLRSVSFAVLGTLAFLAVSLTVGRRVVSDLIRWANDHFASDFPVITMILLITIAMALTTYLIGVHTVLGAFVAGVLIGESPILTRHIEEQLRGLIAALFMPVFFGLSGLSADLTILKDPELLLLAIGLIVIASAGKFAGAFVGGKLGRLTGRESLALASAMNARGSTEVIVASIALSAGVFSKNLFTLIVAMAMITTMAMPPMLRWALRRLPLRHAERLRLEREELDARGFVPNLERLLLVVDGSAHGKFASRLAGVIAGSGDKPTTIIELAPQRWPAETVRRNEEQAKEQVRSAAAGTVTLAADPDEETRGSVDVTMRTRRAAKSRSGRRRGAERLRPAHRRDGEDAHGARRIQPGDYPRRRRLQRPACGRDRRRTGCHRDRADRQDPHPGQRHRRFAARRRDRLRAGKVDRVARERTLRGDRRLQWRRPRPHPPRRRHAAQRRGGAQGHRRARRPLRRQGAHGAARRCRRRGGDPARGQARELRPRRPWRHPPPRRHAVLRQHGRRPARTLRHRDFVRRELTKSAGVARMNEVKSGNGLLA